MIKTLAVKFRTDDEGAVSTAKELVAFAADRGLRLLILAEGGRGHSELERFIVNEDEFINASELVLAIGGDGTFLRTAEMFAKRDVPIMGINRGRLGFLTEFNPDEYSKYLSEVIDGNFHCGKRAMMNAVIIRDGKEAENFDFLNDAVISQGSVARAMTLSLELDGAFLNTYAGDGLIVSTATGSTAYSLSAGGPVLSPQLRDIFLLTPICPHSLTMRPMVLPGASVLKAQVIRGQRNLLLTMDGQEVIEIDKADGVLFRASGRQINLVMHPEKNFYDILREKLNWGK